LTKALENNFIGSYLEKKLDSL